ncbi:MAG: hypothetical protein ABSG50_02650 [Opitutaceae bacterium]
MAHVRRDRHEENTDVPPAPVPECVTPAVGIAGAAPRGYTAQS